jgi:hypothetical protein
MGKQEKQDEDPKDVSSFGSNLLILGTIADTTWRMFTPVLGLLLAGMWLDGKTGSKPWFTIGGVCVGFACAIGLIYLQYQRVLKK